ncbi:hypothetical protein [Streptomyces sp. SP18CS02]|uniref:hypothetical protein n=1 Tax=Streptomyces sp. SP18CS02 TaxID=3002531 RepID=UPI002E798C89|nr:hypothetical protein [Streptomyces sp. SP18CS02]MEE1755777.1 hypothetical protein [Streptomyces sp. SP18CS02]
MPNPIARLLEPLLRRLLPPSGRRRRTAGEAVLVVAVGPTGATLGGPALRGEDSALVRPYLEAHERSRRTRRQLWLAPRGTDLAYGLVAR